MQTGPTYKNGNTGTGQKKRNPQKRKKGWPNMHEYKPDLSRQASTKNTMANCQKHTGIVKYYGGIVKFYGGIVKYYVRLNVLKDSFKIN